MIQEKKSGNRKTRIRQEEIAGLQQQSMATPENVFADNF